MRIKWPFSSLYEHEELQVQHLNSQFLSSIYNGVHLSLQDKWLFSPTRMVVKAASNDSHLVNNVENRFKTGTFIVLSLHLNEFHRALHIVSIFLHVYPNCETSNKRRQKNEHSLLFHSVLLVEDSDQIRCFLSNLLSHSLSGML